jgi:sporulation protein YlmC with PRC-barrel domain
MRSITLLSCAALVASLVSVPAFSQGAQQTLTSVNIDPMTLATGYRTSKVVGSAVYNTSNESVGNIDDLIVTPNDKVPFAVLSVGGFLGIDAKLVVVPFNTIEVRDKRLVLPGATKDSLKALPAFKYNY